jgi:hypothetical protein
MSIPETAYEQGFEGDEVCNDKATIREIVLWALVLHRDDVGEHLDLSDEELQNLLERVS